MSIWQIIVLAWGTGTAVVTAAACVLLLIDWAGGRR